MGKYDKYDNLLKSYASFKNAVNNLYDAFSRVEDSWNAAEDVESELISTSIGADIGDIDFAFGNYPFDKSFDEMCSEVGAWANEVDEWFKVQVDTFYGREA